MIARLCSKSKVRDQYGKMIEIFCYGAELFSLFKAPPMLARLLIGSPETVLSAIHEC
jgi:hypothetical protein